MPQSPKEVIKMSLQSVGYARREFDDRAMQHDLFHFARFELGGRFGEAIPLDVGVSKCVKRTIVSRKLGYKRLGA